MADPTDFAIWDRDVLWGDGIPPNLDGVLREKFIIPPFTVLDARNGAWLSRKRAWLKLGIRSEHRRGAKTYGSGGSGELNQQYKDKPVMNLGGETGSPAAGQRGYKKKETASDKDNLTYGTSFDPDWTDRTKKRKQKTNDQRSSQTGGAFRMTNQAGEPEGEVGEGHYDSSHFDPVLCELVYRWFTPPGGLILDPFAGSSVSGIMAALTGRRFWGSDLADGQVEANRTALKKVESWFPQAKGKVKWVHGDALDMLDDAPEYDLLFDCPPYYDLEVYSENPNDLSAMSWDSFRSAYQQIISKCVDKLRDNRFAVIVIGDVRDKKGNYLNLPAITTTFFRRAGMELYNQGILVTAVGSLSIRTESQFVMSRKLGMTHQHVQVYVKGDPRLATDYATGMMYGERREMLKRRTEERRRAASGEGWDDPGERESSEDAQM